MISRAHIPAGTTRAVVLVLLLATASAACAPGEPDAPDVEHVRAIVLPYLTMMPFHIAAEEGYFVEQGLDVDFVRLTRNQDIMTALARDHADVAAGMLTANELSLAAGGARIRVVGGLNEESPDHCPFAALVARRELLESGALEDPERVRELRFDVDTTLPLGYWTDLGLADLGLTLADVRTVSVPPPAALGALDRGTIDVTVDSVPFITRMQESGTGAIWRTVGGLAPGYPVSVIMYGPDLLDERPEAGRRFAVAMLRAIRQFSLGKTERNLEIVERATELDRTLLENACWPRVRQDGAVDPAPLRPYQQWSVSHGLIDRVLEDEELFDSRFMEHANEALDG